MGDMAIAFREMTRYRKQKRIENTETSTELLKKNGVAFESKNWGRHLIIKHDTGVYDFWPSTGKWRNRSLDPDQYRRGVFKLFKAMKIEVRN